MSSDFNAYHEWLGIPPNEQPPNHYRLLGLVLFESSRSVIESAADRQMSFVRQHGMGPHSEESQKLLNEISLAQIELLNPSKRAAYDEKLKQKLGQAAPAEPADARPAGRAETAAAVTATKAAGSGGNGKSVKPTAAAAGRTRASADATAAARGRNAPATPRWTDSAKSDPGEARAQRRREQEGVGSLFAAAKRLKAKHDYTQAAQLLEQISPRERTPEIDELLRQITDLEEEAELLLGDLRQAVHSRQLDGIEDNLKRLLQIKPGNQFARELRESLQSYGGDRRFRYDAKGKLLPREGGEWFDGAKAAILVAAAAFAIMTFGVTIYLRDDRQTVTVEVDEGMLKDGTVTLSVEGQNVQLKGLGDTIHLKPGPHGYEVRRGDTVVVGPASFTVRKGERNVLTISVANAAGRTAEATTSSTPKVAPPANPSPVPAPPLAAAPFNAAQAKAHQEAWAKQLGVPVEYTDVVGMQFVLIPPGEFLMGSPDSDPDAGDDEKPQRVVRLTRPFYLARNEATQSQWKAVLGTEPWAGASSAAEDLSGPASNVTFEEAIAFCRNLSQRRQDGARYRLPTEAEWEFACRAGTTTTHYFGDEAGLDEHAWHRGNSEKKLHRVGQKKPNPFGLFDMAGNAWEWCSDWYDRYDASAKEDPQGPAAGKQQLTRGGGYGSPRKGSYRSARREPSPLGDRGEAISLRVVLEIAMPKPSAPASTPSLPPLADWTGPAPPFDWKLAAERPATTVNCNFEPLVLVPTSGDGLFPNIPTRFTEKKATIYAGGNGRTVTFEVASAGFAFVGCNYGNQGNSSGGWVETRWLAEKFLEKGWQELTEEAVGGKLVKKDNRAQQIFVKFLMKGEKLSLQCNKYDPPFLIVFDRGATGPAVTDTFPERKPAPAQPPAGSKEITISGTDGATSRQAAFGPLRKGQVLRMQYLSGAWSDIGSAPPGSPDDLELKHPNVPRVRVCTVSGEQISFLAQLPGGTAERPFALQASQDYAEIIFNNADPKAGNNPGEVKYRVWIEDAAPAASGSPPR